MPHNFWENARIRPEADALVGEDGLTLTFGEAANLADQYATVFAELGLRPGDTISIMAENRPHWLVVYLAALQSGLYFTPVPTKATVDDLAVLWKDSETRLIVVDEQPSVAAAQAADLVGIDRNRRLTLGASRGFDSLAAAVRDLPISAKVPPRRAGMRKLYTGGTTGAPRGVYSPLPTHGPEEVAAEAITSPQLLGMRAGNTRHLVAGPLYHGGPLAYALAALHLGSTVVLPLGWETEKILRLIDKHSVNSTFMVPTMMSRLAAFPAEERGRYNLSSLETIIHGAAPCPPALKYRLMEWLGPVLYEFYAATEAGGTYVTPEEWLERPGTVGRPLPGREVHILDEQELPCAPFETGRVYMRSHVTGQLVWPGDLGRLDEDGWLYLTDRLADVIITGGVNVYSSVVEARLAEFPGVEQCAVIGLPDPEWGEAVVAVLVADWTEAERAEREREMRTFASGVLTPPQRPKQYLLVDKLPLTAANKVDKRSLRAHFAVPTGAL